MRVDLQRTVTECGSKAAREEWVEAQLIGEYAEYIGLALPGACMRGQGACVGRVCVWRARGVRVACAELLVCEGCSLYPPFPPYSPYSPCPPCYIPHALYSLGDEAFLEIAREGMRETTEGCPEGWARYTYIYVYICAQMDLLRWYACCTYCVLAALTH